MPHHHTDIVPIRRSQRPARGPLTLPDGHQVNAHSVSFSHVPPAGRVAGSRVKRRETRCLRPGDEALTWRSRTGMYLGCRQKRCHRAQTAPGSTHHW
jgi:hypothetical protein